VRQGHNSPPRLFVNFMGLLGPNGPLPLHICEYVHDREFQAHDHTIARFFDLFNHRAISLFYRAWAVNQMSVSRDRFGDDSFARYVGSFFGLEQEAFRNRDEVPDDAKLHYVGHLAARTRYPEGLSSILADFFGVAARIQEFVGHWMDVPDDCLCRLGGFHDAAILGETAVLGARVWECTQKFRLRLGPLRFADYDRFLPGRSAPRRLAAWVRNFIGREFIWDVSVALEEAPRTELGRVGRLGWTTWLMSDTPEGIVEDLLYGPGEAENSPATTPEDSSDEVMRAAQQPRREDSSEEAVVFDVPLEDLADLPPDEPEDGPSDESWDEPKASEDDLELEDDLPADLLRRIEVTLKRIEEAEKPPQEGSP